MAEEDADERTGAASPATTAGAMPPSFTAEDLRRAAAAHPPDISFQNRAAVSVAMTMAAACMLLFLVPVPDIFQMFWKLVTLLAAGFIAVYLYHRRTGQALTVRSGARMGWMTGVFSFLIALVLTVSSIALLSAQGNLSEIWKEQVANYPASSADLQEAMRILESPAGMAMLISTILMVLFLLFTALPMIGGALGAKVLEKE